MTLEILVTLLLVFLNGFFVAAEFAIVKVRSSQIALQSGLSKKAAEAVLENLDGFLAATQLGITLASLGLGWVGEDVVSRIILNVMDSMGLELDDKLAHRIAFPVAFVVITILHIVFGELAPKSLAIQYPTATTMKLALPLRLFYFFFKPVIFVLNGFANMILRLLGIRPVREQIHSEEELKLIIAESEEGGAIETSERELIQNVFDFDNRIVRQVMVPRLKVTGMSVGLSMEEALRIVLKEGYSRYPVYEGSLDEITGIVHAKDIVANHVEKTTKTLRDILRPAFYITENKGIDTLLREFQRKKVQMAVVISEFGGTMGIVTLEDILEELVGEIQDEHDQEQQVVTQLGENHFQILARSPIHDINKLLEIPFPESEEYDTLAGLITNTKSDLKEGDQFTMDGYQIRIVKMNRSMPELVEVRHTPESND
ncbi:MAG: hemolysin family protein [Cyclobacteriaceae bacterium]|jgi:CBS domain containing-hemolysin-like protein